MYNDYLADPAKLEGKIPEKINNLGYEESLIDKVVENTF